MGYVITIKEPIKELDMFPERKGKIDVKLIHLNKMLFTENISRHGLGMILGNTYVVVVFPQAPFRVTNVPKQASAGIIHVLSLNLDSKLYYCCK